MNSDVRQIDLILREMRKLLCVMRIYWPSFVTPFLHEFFGQFKADTCKTHLKELFSQIEAGLHNASGKAFLIKIVLWWNSKNNRDA